jgi:hypothetical protein
MINVDYPQLLDLFREHLDPKRSESASFLIWYLENYYRLDPIEAVDCVCDQRGDKGVDGIFVNDNDLTITVFQSKISQSSDKAIGDAFLRDLAGALTQFASAETIQTLLDASGDAKVTTLIKRLDLINKIGTHQLRGEFLSNIDPDANGENFLKSAPQITFIGKQELQATYISAQRNLPVHTPVTFDIGGFHVTRYDVEDAARAIIAPIKATELVGLSGIPDQSLFAYNVRGALGRTQVNRDIVDSIREPSRHKLFPLFHNGVTLICNNLTLTEETLSVSDYYVVNGCQSLTALFNNRKRLTDNLRIVVKFILMDPASTWAEMVTRFSNNQNAVKPRDFMANNRIQIRLQNEFLKLYRDRYAFEIKRGEILGRGTPISNEDAGLFLMAFDLKEPWATHRKYQVFEERHADLFGRPEVTADRIVLCQVIMEVVTAASSAIKNTLFGRYILTRYLILYIVREILENDDLGKQILTNPAMFVRADGDRGRFHDCVRLVIDDAVIDLNAEVEEYGEDFDYRDKLRDSDWVRKLSRKVVADNLKLVKRGRSQSFKDAWLSSSK